MDIRGKQKQYKFTLSVRDKHNREVKRIVDFLAGKGVLSQAVRDGLRLLNDLRRGNTRVLLEMFPDVIDKLCPPPSAKNDIDELKRMIVQLQEQQPRIVYVPTDGGIPEDAPLVGKGAVVSPPKKLSSGTGNIPGAGVPMTLPNFDDDDDDMGETMLIKKTEPPKMNLLEGLFAVMDNGLQGKNHTADANAKALKGLRQH